MVQILHKKILTLLENSINDIYANTIDICEIYEAMHRSIPAIIYWIYTCSGSTFSEMQCVKELPIHHVVKAESTLWSPEWGLKGIIDTICNMQLNGKNTDIPFEIKTGKEDPISHGVQISLYSILLSQMNEQEDFVLYSPSQTTGYLVYVKSPFSPPEGGYMESQYNEIKQEMERGTRGNYITQLMNEVKKKAEALVMGWEKNTTLNCKAQKLNEYHLRSLIMRRNLIVSYLERERRNRKQVIKAYDANNNAFGDIEDIVSLSFESDE